MHGRIGYFGLLLIVTGCFDGQSPPVPVESGSRAALGQAFEPGATGTIAGQVAWDGDVPVAVETVVRESPFNPFLHQKPARFLTPHVPRVKSKTGGVDGAVVYVKHVDPRRSRAWDLANVRIEFHERELRIHQGNKVGSVGFVQRGSAVELVNADTEYHLLRARGAAFFATPLIEPNKVHERQLTDTGVVDLTCSAGWHWLHGHLFVADHPYFVQTDADGRFVLEGVPAGTYELVCWLPSWRVLRTERDPETANIARFAWDAPKEQTRTVHVMAGQLSDITYRWNRAVFENDGKR